MYAALRSLLFLLPAEAAHRVAALSLRLLALAPWLCRLLRPADDPRLQVSAFGLRFPNPLGMAAGFDKGQGLAPALFALGFGSVEVGTVTPLPQPGNERPRLFRLPGQRALVNRMGFNNAGALRVARLHAGGFRPGPLGMNLGKNKDTGADAAAGDYLRALQVVREAGDYFVVNVSSPNTPGLRDLQAPEALRRILGPLLPAAGGKPVLLKLAPDLGDEAVDALSDLAVAEGLSGIVLANTTVGRPGVGGEAAAREKGGMSGAPLLSRAVQLVARVRARHGDRLPIVGVGGIFSGQDAYRMIRAGAVLVQAYTGFIYRGPSFPRRVCQELLDCLARDGFETVGDAVGADLQSSRVITIASSPSSE